MSYDDDLSLGFNFNDDDKHVDGGSAGEGAQEDDLADAESNADEDEEVSHYDRVSTCTNAG